MDMTGWLEYYVEGLKTQLVEVHERGEHAIRRDVLANTFRLTERQIQALGYVLDHGSLKIRDFERLYPKVNRRTLQRDLKEMIAKGVFRSEGSTNQLVYRLKE